MAVGKIHKDSGSAALRKKGHLGILRDLGGETALGIGEAQGEGRSVHQHIDPGACHRAIRGFHDPIHGAGFGARQGQPGVGQLAEVPPHAKVPGPGHGGVFLHSQQWALAKRGAGQALQDRGGCIRAQGLTGGGEDAQGHLVVLACKAGPRKLGIVHGFQPAAGTPGVCCIQRSDQQVAQGQFHVLVSISEPGGDLHQGRAGLQDVVGADPQSQVWNQVGDAQGPLQQGEPGFRPRDANVGPLSPGTIVHDLDRLG